MLERVRAIPFEEIESDFADLADAQSRAMEYVAPGGAYAWAVGFTIMDFEALREGTIHDPAVATWSRPQSGAQAS